MKTYYNFLILSFMLVIYNANGQSEKVATKLDLDESKEDSGSRHHSSPKIQGVSVTVDTTGVKKSRESGSKESVEVIENKNKNKQRFGIHTDITFEITDDKNRSSSEQSDKDDDNASVPVFKGRTTTQNPRKPYDPKSPHWVPSRPLPGPGPVHHHFTPNVPVFPQTNDEGIYRSIDNWSNYVPVQGVWTTERVSHRHPLKPNSVAGFKSYSSPNVNSRWQPCLCDNDNNHWRDTSASAPRPSFRVASHVIGVDDKLSSPFSRRRRNIS